jgi:hypothetical protein
MENLIKYSKRNIERLEVFQGLVKVESGWSTGRIGHLGRWYEKANLAEYR